MTSDNCLKNKYSSLSRTSLKTLNLKFDFRHQKKKGSFNLNSKDDFIGSIEGLLDSNELYSQEKILYTRSQLRSMNNLEDRGSKKNLPLRRGNMYRSFSHDSKKIAKKIKKKAKKELYKKGYFFIIFKIDLIFLESYFLGMNREIIIETKFFKFLFFLF